jgi:hypothetical protein
MLRRYGDLYETCAWFTGSVLNRRSITLDLNDLLSGGNDAANLTIRV